MSKLEDINMNDPEYVPRPGNDCRWEALLETARMITALGAFDYEGGRRHRDRSAELFALGEFLDAYYAHAADLQGDS